ncbi:MAG: hypothetical protein VKL98_01470 [Cyanobacteriota bacterium]|nr:hypothetical protein [Cyanobacteriota bacterium]
MSEYQYYEFQSIDRPLTPEEQADVQRLSSRVKLSSTQAVFVYNYGDFRADPEQVLTQYFDMMFYITNWGTCQVLFRLPLTLVEPTWFQPYCVPDAIAIRLTPDYLILDITIQEEEGTGLWVEGEGWLPRLLPLRDDLLGGDLRLMYLSWLRVAQHLAGVDLPADPLEPPVPPNLGQLSPALQTFIELVELDTDLVTAAAQASGQQQPEAEARLEEWLSALSEAEVQDFLLKLVRREPHVDLQLINRLKELAQADGSAAFVAAAEQRPLSELVATAAILKQQRQQQEQAAARAKRQRQLEILAPKAAQTWDRIHQLIALKQAKAYDEAVALLQDLRDLAELQGRLPQFRQQLQALKSNYSNRPALLQRLQSTKLSGTLR